jgi:uncharacterized protein (DUF1330 family)
VDGGAFLLVVTLWIDRSRVQEFEAYEGRAADVMSRHGGRIERAIRLEDSAENGNPFEVHLVSFPSRQAFEEYREDPEVQSLAPQRESVITRTSVLIGQETEYVPHLV